MRVAVRTMCGAALLWTGGAQASSYSVLYNFTGAAASGGQVPAALTMVGGVLYGTTVAASPGGSILYSINPASGANRIVRVLQDPGNGTSAQASTLMPSGQYLFGLTLLGGRNHAGTLFAYDTVSDAYADWYDFSGALDGSGPDSAWALCGSIYYGATLRGGANDAGAIYKMFLVNNVVPLVYSFSGGTDGAGPVGALSCAYGVVFGATLNGGAYGAGTLFMVNTVTGTKTTLHSFGGPGDAQTPNIGPILYNGNLYGTAQYRGPSGYGEIYRYNFATGQFSILHGFGYTDGGWPFALTLSQNTLYGATSTGGSGKSGTLYSFNLSTNALTTLYSFTGKADGGNPFLGSLLYSAGVLYGTTSQGGSAGFGTVFRFQP